MLGSNGPPIGNGLWCITYGHVTDDVIM